MKLLVTGFEPFGGSDVNPAQRVVETLAQTPPPGIDLRHAILPVDGSTAPAALLAALERCWPQAVLCLGQATSRSTLSIERVALNLLDYSVPDNAGVVLVDQPIAPDGPAAYFTTLPVRAMLAAMRAARVPAELSLSAGAFLCNQVLYTVLHYIATHGLPVRAGFIHLPALPEQAAKRATPTPSMSLETMVAGVGAAIQAIQGDVP